MHKTNPHLCLSRGRKDRNRAARSGGADSSYCAAWGCEITGTVHWLTNPAKDLIQVKLPQDFPPCKMLSSKPGQCFPLQIKFTDEGKKFTRWDVGRAWGLRLYQTGFNNGFWFDLKLQLGPLYLDPKVALGPNQVIDSPRTFFPEDNPKTSLPEPKLGYWIYSTPHSSPHN